MKELEVRLDAERTMHEKQKKELEAKVSSLQAEVRNAKSSKLKDGKGKESELKVLKAQE